jgi:hypothetical protein
MSSAEGDFAPGRLWSLWEMLSLKADTFYKVTQNIRHTRALIEQWKYRTDSEGVKTSDALDNDMLKTMSEQALRLALLLRVLDARVTAIAVSEHIDSLKGDGPVTYDDIAESYIDIDKSLRRELSLVDLLVLRGETAKYFEPESPLFGNDFAQKFNTSGAYELDEAGKCLAVDRGTACVFHLMRMMEIGISALAKSLQIPDPLKPVEKNWGYILERIWVGIEKKWPNGGARMNGDGALFDALYASLDAVKNPWRNGTMHVERKYTVEEARHVFDAVRGFMNRLAERMDENGLPIA